MRSIAIATIASRQWGYPPTSQHICITQIHTTFAQHPCDVAAHGHQQRPRSRDSNRAGCCCVCLRALAAHARAGARFTHIIKCSALNDDHRSHLIDKLHLFY